MNRNPFAKIGVLLSSLKSSGHGPLSRLLEAQYLGLLAVQYFLTMAWAASDSL
jgi:hypothetical protein